MKSGLFQKLIGSQRVGHSQFSATYLFSGQGLQNVQKLDVHTRRVHGIFYQHNLPSLLRSYMYSSNPPAPSGGGWVGWDLVANILTPFLEKD